MLCNIRAISKLLCIYLKHWLAPENMVVLSRLRRWGGDEKDDTGVRTCTLESSGEIFLKYPNLEPALSIIFA